MGSYGSSIACRKRPANANNLTNQLKRGLRHIAYLKSASFTIGSMEFGELCIFQAQLGVTYATNMATLAADVQRSRRPNGNDGAQRN